MARAAKRHGKPTATTLTARLSVLIHASRQVTDRSKAKAPHVHMSYGQYQDFSRAHNVVPKKDPMSTLDMALLPACTLHDSSKVPGLAFHFTGGPTVARTSTETARCTTCALVTTYLTKRKRVLGCWMA